MEADFVGGACEWSFLAECLASRMSSLPFECLNLHEPSCSLSVLGGGAEPLEEGRPGTACREPPCLMGVDSGVKNRSSSSLSTDMEYRVAVLPSLPIVPCISFGSADVNLHRASSISFPVLSLLPPPHPHEADPSSCGCVSVSDALGLTFRSRCAVGVLKSSRMVLATCKRTHARTHARAHALSPAGMHTDGARQQLRQRSCNTWTHPGTRCT